MPAKKSFQPYHAQSVPKSEDLEAVAFSRQNSGDVDVTTMMLRNIPNKYTQNSLLQVRSVLLRGIKTLRRLRRSTIWDSRAPSISFTSRGSVTRCLKLDR